MLLTIKLPQTGAAHFALGIVPLVVPVAVVLRPADNLAFAYKFPL
jgi:hypothetical protein